MKVAYNILTGEILAAMPKEQKLIYFFSAFDEEYMKTVSEIDLPKEISIIEVDSFIVKNKSFQRMSNQEKQEMMQYKRLLTDTERKENQLLDNLMYSEKEIWKAENTIEILSLLQGVL